MTEYCDERAFLSVCLSVVYLLVCLYAWISQEPSQGRATANFLRILPVAVLARSSADGVPQWKSCAELLIRISDLGLH